MLSRMPRHRRRRSLAMNLPISSVISDPHVRRNPEPYYLPLTRSLHPLLPSTLMSSTTASSARFQSILEAAFDSYAKQTGVELAKHPSMHKLENCHSPDDVLQLLLEREIAFHDYRDKHRKLLDCLGPVVQVVHTFSAVFGEVAGFVRSGQRIHLLRSYHMIFTCSYRYHFNRQMRYLLASTFSSQYVSISICPIRFLA